ncbi:MAG: FAD-binding oxidoreductase [candidate division NC10 bacterium]|nr:FAD-binding oxidoreductase [candidate division NC10 bacterium]
MRSFDAVIIGGGFFGCYVALSLRRAFSSVAVVEREPDLLTRASYVNQARVHNGYHYPRSLMTALRSRVNFPRFCEEFGDCVETGFTKLYAIARESKVTAMQFERFCHNIGARIDSAPPRCRALFDSTLIEEVFVVRECAFNAVKLRARLKALLTDAGVEVLCGTSVRRVAQGNDGDSLDLELVDGRLSAGHVFNCTYSQTNTILRQSGLPLLPLKHELCEQPLLVPPPPLAKLGVTVIDGPFFSTMPFPARGLHSLHHVRYTPHHFWLDQEEYRDPEDNIRSARKRSRYPYMIRDIARFVPVLERATYVESLWEMKTVLPQNEIDDGRPILLRRDHGLRNLTVVLGAKIDNIYDVIDTMDKTLGLPGYSRQREPSAEALGVHQPRQGEN